MCRLMQDQVKTIYILKKTLDFSLSRKGEIPSPWACLCSCRASAYVREKQNPKLPTGGKSEYQGWVEQAVGAPELCG